MVVVCCSSAEHERLDTWSQVPWMRGTAHAGYPRVGVRVLVRFRVRIRVGIAVRFRVRVG